MNRTQVCILESLATNPGQIIPRQANGTGKAFQWRTIRKLEAAGFIEDRPREDGIHAYHLTPACVEMMATAQAAVAKVLTK